MTGIYKESAQKVTNRDVKTAFIDVLDDLDKLIGLLNTDENASASPDYESTQDSMDTHGGGAEQPLRLHVGPVTQRW